MVTVIFKNLQVKDFLNRFNKFIKSNRAFKYALCSTLVVAAAFLTIIASGVTFGYTVKYSDEVIAVVSSQADYKKADKIVINSLDKTAYKAARSPKFGITLTVADNLNTTNEIVEAIINNNDDIVKATALIVNGEVKLCAKSDKLNEMVNARLTQYYTEGAENSSSFTADVKVENGYYLTEDLVNEEEAQTFINTLEVKTVTVKTETITVPFQTKNNKTSEKPVGYTLVTKKGENGLTERTDKITTLNGTVSATERVSEKVIKEQVTQVVTVGTGVKYTNATTKSSAVSSGFICPITKGKFIVSAYWGDGRNHKAIDLAADRGTPIFAAAAGTVTSAGWDTRFGYGYNVIITHANGTKTRYAHANALCVKAGDKVSQGDMIATVGSTGNSTGNHLHFEIIINGNRVNPGPYIGLR